MDSSYLPVIATAVCTLISTALAAILLHVRKLRKYENDSMVSNYQTLYRELRQEITRLGDEQREERKQWAEERKSLYAKIDAMQELIRKQDIILHEKEILVTSLNGKVDVLTSQLEFYRGDHPAKTTKVNITT